MTPTSDGQDPFGHLADRFLAHYDTLRGAVRDVLIAEQLAAHLLHGRLRVVDLGGGGGQQAIRLARRGHDVTLVDPSSAMLAAAEAALEDEPPQTAARVRLVQATAQQAARVLEEARFQVVCCHGVLPYVADPAPVIQVLAGLAAPGAVVSLLFKNADALAMRPALEGRWADALAALDADGDIGGMQVPTRAHRREDITGLLAAAGLQVTAWFGIRIFSDHLHDQPAGRLGELLPLEREAARRDPYRSVGRLLHLIAHPSGG